MHIYAEEKNNHYRRKYFKMGRWPPFGIYTFDLCTTVNR